MGNRAPFAPGEWYHCYSRGVDRRRVFETKRDYERFTETLYLCNSAKPIHQDNLRRFSHEQLFGQARGNPLVAIAAYCLMPNHFHLLLQEATNGGITSFMRKVGTAYTMYFNIKNERTGNLFAKPFRSRRVGTDAHFMHIHHYLHLNPAGLFESGWKYGKVKSRLSLEKRLEEYPFSSLCDYQGRQRPERAILQEDAVSLFNAEPMSISRLVSDAVEYHRGLAP